MVGASGYTGAELVRLLRAHPELELTHLSAGRSAGRAMDEVFAHLAGIVDADISQADPDAIAEAADVAFLALPHGQSAKTASELRERGLKVVDLSADFRLRDLQVYGAFYGEHGAPGLADEAVYGLPERYRDSIKAASLIACPGCFPTSAILASAPLLQARLVQTETVVVDSKSGVSGAGRTPKLATHFPEAGEGIRAYAVAGAHRHTPEIEQELAVAAGGDVSVLFTPHLVPMSRGILSCVYLDVADEGVGEAELLEVMHQAYDDEPFVTVLDDRVPDTAFVRGSNYAQVTVRLDKRTRKVLAICAIDNLVKGAAGQAVQCLNLMSGFDETLGLRQTPLFP